MAAVEFSGRPVAPGLEEGRAVAASRPVEKIGTLPWPGNGLELSRECRTRLGEAVAFSCEKT